MVPIYKAFWADPPSCAVGEPRNGFRGENSFPLIIQNLHRYFQSTGPARHRGAIHPRGLVFWADPPSCAVGEPRNGFRGENSFPLIIQNLHRYFLYLALLFILVLSYDVWVALWFPIAGSEGVEFGLGVGTLVLALNVVLLGSYTLGCHSLRHLIGGRRDCISESSTQKTAYDCVSCLNRRHMMYAWMSLFWVGFSDLYVRLCSMGIWADFRIL